MTHIHTETQHTLHKRTKKNKNMIKIIFLKFYIHYKIQLIYKTFALFTKRQLFIKR